MPSNEATWDRLVRIAIGLLCAVVAWRMWPDGPLTSAAGVAVIALLFAAIVAVLTGATGVCPAYWLFGVSTRRHPA